jgi:WhiB family transcriptional regulator, redox-sensing transcriptional regulator
VNDDLDWRQRGACRDEDPELFHPTGTSGPAMAQLEEAKTVCGWCSVRQECLDYALRHGVEYGVYGGTSEAERRALRRPTRRPKRQPEPPLQRQIPTHLLAREGRQAIRNGMSIEEAAATFEVTLDTARRWRQKVRLEIAEQEAAS